MSFQNKVKFPLWAYPETMTDVEVHYKNDNCKSQSEFIEKAIKFYVGYLDEEKSVNYISPMITETVKAQIKGTEQRLARLMFKVAVELGKLSHMTAAMNDVDEETLKSDMQLLKEGFQMLQYDYIGGNGSRGYGKGKFYDLEAVVVIGKVSEETMEECNRILSEV